jgi:perosamine synthetase
MQKKYNQVTPLITSTDIENVKNYLSSGGWITEHEVTKLFENDIKKYVKRQYAVAVPNGTIAIYLALLSAGIGKGDKVAVPNLTMIATINAIMWTGATPEIIDVDEELCMSFKQLSKINSLSAVIFVPLNGRTGLGKEIEQWCREKEILLIEDSAHALGSSYSNSLCGSLGDLSIFSFTPHKIITTGQGGMVLTDNEKFYNLLIDLKTFNREKDKSDWHKGFGLNFKFTDLQAALGRSQFLNLEKNIKNKIKNYHYFQENISDGLSKSIPFKKTETPWFNEMVLPDKETKNKLKDFLKINGIETRDFYPPISHQKYLKRYVKRSLHYSENISSRIIWLPSSNDLRKKDIVYISSKINDFIKSSK